MELIRTIADLRRKLKSFSSQIIGFVPTMGSLHKGHISLIEKAKLECDYVVVSIFVNKLQFNDPNDFKNYPRDFKKDERILQKCGVDFLFIPEDIEIFPQPMLTTLTVSKITDVLCGKSRPGHFEGVATVLAKLFNIIIPEKVYLGIKDAQQVAVVNQVIKDLNYDIELIACPTIREEDGLALSSRNILLDKVLRKEASTIYSTLNDASRKIKKDRTIAVQEIISTIKNKLSCSPKFRIDYVEILSYPDFNKIDSFSRSVIIAVAVWLGEVRLIDNLIVEFSQ